MLEVQEELQLEEAGIITFVYFVSLRDGPHLFKICFEYLSASIFAVVFRDLKSLLLDSSYADFAILAVVGSQFAEDSFMD